MDRPAIELSQLTKNYGRVTALRGIDLKVHTGEIYGFLGPNGAGKTTAIRCMLDLIRPSSGKIRVLGMDPQLDPTAVKRRVGYLPGELHFDENQTGRGTLAFLARLRSNAIPGKRINQLAERLDLALDRPIKNLSKGNKQKLGVLQAFMRPVDLLLLDEPTIGLDPLMQQEVLGLVKEARESGATVFFSSHILQEVQSIADRAAIIRSGLIAEEVDTSSLSRRSLRRVRIDFKSEVDASGLTTLEGVSLLSSDNGRSVLLQVEGDMEAFLKRVASYPVENLETERPSLEEVFMNYYRNVYDEVES